MIEIFLYTATAVEIAGLIAVYIVVRLLIGAKVKTLVDYRPESRELRILKDLLAFMESQRRGGTTLAITSMAKTVDAWVLVPNEKVDRVMRDIHRSVVTFKGLSRAAGKYRRPVLVDNYAMLEILRMAIREIEGPIVKQEVDFKQEDGAWSEFAKSAFDGL
jgi:hypothetical protein